MLHEKVGEHGTQNRGHYQVAQKLIKLTLFSEGVQSSSKWPAVSLCFIRSKFKARFVNLNLK